MREVTMFESNDGLVFKSEKECSVYEKNLSFKIELTSIVDGYFNFNDIDIDKKEVVDFIVKEKECILQAIKEFYDKK